MIFLYPPLFLFTLRSPLQIGLISARPVSVLLSAAPGRVFWGESVGLLSLSGARVVCLVTRALGLGRRGTGVWVAPGGDALVGVVSWAASSLWVSCRDGAEAVAFWGVVLSRADSHNIHYSGGTGAESGALSS